MKKKLTAVALVVCMLAVMLVGASLAYFTDNDKVKNTFTVGNVDIDLWEYTGEKIKGEDDKEIPKKEQTGHTYTGLMPTDKLTKEPVIENTSKTNTAYVRVAVVMNKLKEINDSIDKVYENLETPKTDAGIQAIYDKVFDGWGLSYLKTDDEPRRLWMDEADHSSTEKVDVIGIDMWSRNDESYGQFSEANLFQSENEKNSYGDGIVYIGEGWTSYYQNAAKVNERVFVFYLKMEPESSYQLFNGLNVPADFSNAVTVKYDGKDRTFDQMSMFDGLNIGIYADAIQIEGFNTHVDAFNALEAEHPLGWWN